MAANKRNAADPANQPVMLRRVIAQQMAMELVLQSTIGMQIARRVSDPADQEQVEKVARFLRESIIAAGKAMLAGLPDQSSAKEMEAVLQQTVTRLYRGAAMQVKQSVQGRQGAAANPGEQ